MKNVKVKIITTRKHYLKWSFRPTFTRKKQLRNGAIAIEKEKCRINLNRPTYVGTSILDLSKVIMQLFDYDYTKNKYDDKAGRFLRDTDSQGG